MTVLWNRHDTGLFTYGMWTNMTKWWILIWLADGTGNGQRNFFPPPLPHHAKQFCHFCLVLQNYPIGCLDFIGEGPNARGGKGAWTSDYKTRNTDLISQLKRLDTISSVLWKGNRFNATCALIKKKTEAQTQFRCREWNVGLWISPCFKLYHTSWISEEWWNTELGKQSTQMCVNVAIVMTGLIVCL
jgi:hypothetical protein